MGLHEKTLSAGGEGTGASGGPLSAEPKNGKVFNRFYGELRALAGYHLSRERPDHTLQPTALVHEAYVRLFRQAGHEDTERAKFLSVASEMIRRILVDHARQRNATKRCGKRQRLTLDEISIAEPGKAEVNIVDLDVALKDLSVINERQARVVELRFFAGLSVAETADVLGVSEGTIKGDWRIARAWLRVRVKR